MTTMKIDFTSKVAPAYSVRGNLIVAGRGTMREVNPLEIHNTLYTQFAGLDDDPESFIGFISAFGPVTVEGFLEGDQIDLLIWCRGWMEALIEAAADDPKKVCITGWVTPGQDRVFRKYLLGKLKVPESEILERQAISEIKNPAVSINAVIRPGAPDGRPTLSLSPNSLWDAMKLQFYQAIASGTQIKKCEWCGSWFEVGQGGKRGDAKFCKDNCRLLSHRKLKGVSK